MRIIKIISMTLFMMFVFTCIPGGQVFSQDDPLEDPLAEVEDIDTTLEEEMAWLKAETFVITASRVLENIKKSAASITVITDKEIRLMGARHLMDVLKMVPGISYAYHSDGFYKVGFRGLSTTAGQNVLFMINSHPLNQNFNGGIFPEYATLNVDNIQRVEVIRGPGSALYGANAFSGVINVITKNAEDIEGLQVSARGGSYKTQQYNLLFGKTVNELKIVANFNYLDTDVAERYIAQDLLTAVDQMFGTRASQAPGYTNDHDRRYDAALTLRYKGLIFDGGYTHLEHDWPVGIVFALSDDNSDEQNIYYLTLGYEGTLREGLDLSAKVYRNNYSTKSTYKGFPNGTPVMTPTGPAILLNGGIAEPSREQNRTGVEVVTTYKLGDMNTVVAGATYEKMEQDNVEYSANFLYTPIQNVIIPLPAIQDLTATQNYNKDASRTFKAVFLEDLWDISENLRLTIGARYDDYSDFGGSFNPRAGIAWEFKKGYDLKLLYGRAFRAPSFYELYSQNNPAFEGNPDLDPEIVDTYEVSIGTEISEALSGRITGFRNDIKDSVTIDVVGGKNIFRNKDKIRSQGVETELRYNFGKGTYLAGTYIYQDVQNVDTDERFVNVPKHKARVLANIRLSKYFNLSTSLETQKDYTREEGDTREEPEGFTVVDTSLIARNFIKGLEIRGSVYNLFDQEYSFPTSRDGLPVDLPMPGRTFMVELRYELPL